jgi:predicted nucleic acid-binding Zn ribbon protein
MTPQRPAAGQPSPPPPATGDEGSGLPMARAALAAARSAARARGAGQPNGPAPPGRRTSRRSGRPASDPGTGTGPGPDDRDPQRVAATIDRLVADRGWQEDLVAGGALGRWAAIVGPEIARNAAAERFADGELVVVAATTAWATQLRLLAPSLVRRLNQELGNGTVRRVRVLGPVAPSWRRGPRSVRGRGPRDTYG